MNQEVGANGDPPKPRLSAEAEARLTEAIREVRQPLYRLNLRMCGDHHLAEEFTSVGEMALARLALRGEELEKAPLAYAVTASLNAIRSWARRKTVVQEVPVDQFSEEAVPYPAGRFDRDPTWKAVRLQIELMEVATAIDDQQLFDLWELHFVWQFRGTELADMFDISESKVSRLLTKAKAKVEAAFNPEPEPDEQNFDKSLA